MSQSDEKFFTGRRLLLLLVLIGFAALVTTRFTNLTTLITTLSGGIIGWIILGVIFHILYFVLYAYFYKVGFQIVEVKSKVKNLLPLVFASIFVNAVAPTGGAGGAALFVDDSVQRGESGAYTAVGTILVLSMDLGTLLPFLGYGLSYLASQRNLKFYDVIGAILFFIFTTVLVGALLLARLSPNSLERALRWIKNLVNNIGSLFKRPDLLDKDWDKNNAIELNNGAATISNHPIRLTYMIFIGIVLHVINATGLYAFFLAYSQSVKLGTLLAGFGLGIVFFVITIVPQGIGAVEGIMALVFSSSGIPKAKAIVIALTFRGVNFWLPLVLGFFAIQGISAFGSKSKNPGKD